MKQRTHSPNAYSKPTKTYERVVGQSTAAAETTSRPRCKIFTFDDYAAPRPQVPAKYRAIGDLVGGWERDDKRRAALEEARRWVADEFHGDDGITVRTMRLRKGWSQSRLAEVLATSQSHVARIERGTENLTIETCRKLAAALDVDLNRLDDALKRQEAILRARAE